MAEPLVKNQVTEHELSRFVRCSFGDGGYYNADNAHRAVCSCGWTSAASTDKRALVDLWRIHSRTSAGGGLDAMKFTHDDAELLYRWLRSVCIIRPGQTLHVGGHAVRSVRANKRRLRSWTCPRCSQRNSPGVDNCLACGIERP